MRSIGFVISRKENERRRALIPDDIVNIRNKGQLFFAKGYGEILGISDESYMDMGVNLVSEEEAYSKDIICNPKSPQKSEQQYFHEGQTLFGWIHAVQGITITDFIINKKMTAIAWEDMFEEGLHSFWWNNEIAGEAAIINCLLFTGRLPHELKVGIIGRGNCARGSYKMLSRLGAEIKVYDRNTVHRLRDEIGQYDIIINAILWDIFRIDHLIYKEDLLKMKSGSMIVDISCDPGMEIETSHPTTIENPTYKVDGIIHYAVDHTPSLFYISATKAISAVVCRYVDDLIEGKANSVLDKATIIKDGKIIDGRISRFQKR